MSRKLRPYQSAAVEAIQKAFGSYGSAVCVLPTGCGKTVVSSSLMTGWDQGNCLFLAHTRELVDQAADRLESELGYRPGVEMADLGSDPNTLWSGGLIVVGSVQSMYGDRRLAKYKNSPFGLIVVDECHHATSSTYRKVIDYFRGLNPSLKVLGITATPNRADGSALGTVFESVAYSMGIETAIDDGWLVPIRQQYVVVESMNFDGIKTKKNSLGEMDFVQGQLDEVLEQEEVIHGMVRPTIDLVGNRPTLVFTATVDHAHAFAAVLNRYAGAGSAAAIDGTTDKTRRQELIRDFAAGNLRFLCNCQVLTEGFDAPQCSAVVMGRPTKSLSLYTQMLGRGLRALPGIVDGFADAMDRKLSILASLKPDCLVIDFVGNSSHKLADAVDVLGGQYDAETRELAKQAQGRQPTDVKAALEKAAKLKALERQWAERRHVVATDIRYGSHEVDPFGNGARPGVGSSSEGRGGASDAQVALLVNLGVPRAEALAMGKRQAGAVIDKIGAKRCTDKQAGKLRQYGIDPDGIGFARASRIIDAIAANGWRPISVIPE